MTKWDLEKTHGSFGNCIEEKYITTGWARPIQPS